MAKKWTVEEIEAADIAGYYGPNDSSLWAEMDRLILDETQPFALRVAASKKVDDIIGDDSFKTLSDETRVHEHMQCLLENN